MHVSRYHPGCVWATLQFASELILVDPAGTDPDAPPHILQRIPIPSPGKGPHGVIEHGDDLWASCKDSHHVIRINQSNPADCSIYSCKPRPIFVAVHPKSGDVYASLGQSSGIFRIIRSGPRANTTDTLDIPPSEVQRLSA